MHTAPDSMRVDKLYGSRDVRFEERDDPKITQLTDAIIRISATCVCGSDLWPYRGISPIAQSVVAAPNQARWPVPTLAPRHSR